MNLLKKMNVLGCLALLSILLVACDTSTDEKEKSDKKTDETSEVAKEEEKPEGSGNIKDYAITILDEVELSKDYKDADMIIVSYEFTNNSDENKSFLFAVSDKLFQNGVELERAIVTGNDELGKSHIDVQPGGTLLVKMPYLLQDTTSPVSVEVTDLFGLKKDQKITKELSFE